MTIAIIGASADRRKIEGLQVYTSLLDYPGDIGTASIYLPPKAALSVLEEIAEKGVPEVFVNPGAESEELVARAKELGINAMLACSIIGAGFKPSDLGDE